MWPIRKNYPSENGVYTDFNKQKTIKRYTGNTIALVYNPERSKNTFMLKKPYFQKKSLLPT